MSMTVLNGDKMYHVELNNRIKAYKQNGVLEGLQVYERDPPDRSVNISGGKCYVDNALCTEPGLNVVMLDAGHATLPRFDTIYYNASALSVIDITGTASNTPIPPDVPSEDILLAIVYVPPLHVTMDNGNIKDCRIFIKPTGLKYTASSTLLASDDAEASNNNAVYTKEKEFVIPDDIFEDESEFRIEFELKSSTTSAVHCRVYRNGSYVGSTQISSSTTYANFSQDLTGWSASDLIQMYTHSLDAGRTVYIRNARIYGDIEHISVYDW
ncbi:hypothetical protein KAR91_72265 [Candidatus Pacearchaeota archaeon]|nr:hypothetical protein [Candidatus Pacearchaeota archaeon]